jgi:hypothetical protein
MMGHTPPATRKISSLRGVSKFVTAHSGGFFMSADQEFVLSIGALFTEKVQGIEQVVASVTPKLSVAGGGIAAASGAAKTAMTDQNWMTVADYGVMAGIIVGVVSLVLQAIVFYRRDKREEKLFDAKMDSMHKQDERNDAEKRG